MIALRYDPNGRLQGCSPSDMRHDLLAESDMRHDLLAEPGSAV
ncbi:hypothetical protein SAMN05216412_101222 [Nitrosospira multiformis]|uniref:Uncharacterized protein n=1 Tax=Nitrosospira multiformis TaxID=1231 RepID=A0A1H9YGS6_9PROT|nr:hypothetical protein SAMN05216412_101222 [Nitrosospira multiformis]